MSSVHSRSGCHPLFKGRFTDGQHGKDGCIRRLRIRARGDSIGDCKLPEPRYRLIRYSSHALQKRSAHHLARQSSSPNCAGVLCTSRSPPLKLVVHGRHSIGWFTSPSISGGTQPMGPFDRSGRPAREDRPATRVALKVRSDFGGTDCGRSWGRDARCPARSWVRRKDGNPSK